MSGDAPFPVGRRVHKQRQSVFTTGTMPSRILGRTYHNCYIEGHISEVDQDSFTLTVGHTFGAFVNGVGFGAGIGFEFVSVSTDLSVPFYIPLSLNYTSTGSMSLVGEAFFVSGSTEPPAKKIVMNCQTRSASLNEIDPSNLPQEDYSETSRPSVKVTSTSNNSVSSGRVWSDPFEPFGLSGVNDHTKAGPHIYRVAPTVTSPWSYDESKGRWELVYAYFTPVIPVKTTGSGTLMSSAGQILKVNSLAKLYGQAGLANTRPDANVTVSGSADNNSTTTKKLPKAKWQRNSGGIWEDVEEIHFQLNGLPAEITPEALDNELSLYISDFGALSKRIPINFTLNPQSALEVNMKYGDLNQDNYIGTDDYLILSNLMDTTIDDEYWEYGPDGVPGSWADFNGDLAITTDDYLIFSSNFDLSGDA